MSHNFGEALQAAKNGFRIARAGWNGKGMFVWLVNGSIYADVDVGEEPRISGVRAEYFDLGPEGSITRMPHLCMRAADGATVTGWLASQTDLLADDWEILADVDQ
jgi:hypothetical protein